MRAARLPVAGLAALAALRDLDDVRIAIEAEFAWVRWSISSPEVVRCLLPAAGIVFYVQEGSSWFRFGHRLPAAESPPDSSGVSLASALVPATFEPLVPQPEIIQPLRIRAVRGGSLQTTTALVCRVQNLQAWADRATTHAIGRVRAARSGERAILLGPSLPAIPDSTRYWGTDLLVPIGFRPDPHLPSELLREAIGAAADELALLHEDRAVRVPRAAFVPLTRAGIRLAVREGGAG